MRASSMFAVLLVALLATACSGASPQSGGSPSGASPSGASPTSEVSPTAGSSPTSGARSGTPGAGYLIGTRWVLDSLDGRPPVEGSVITAHFTTEGALAGTSGCNRYRAQASIESDGSIAVDEAIASTMMACEEALMSQEDAYLAALTAARTVSVADGRLTLRDADGAVLATFVVADQELADTSWRITAYHDGGSAVVGVLEDAPATIGFGSDGTVSGSTGCNRLIGEFAASADGGIDIGPLGSTRMMCVEPDGVMEQETAILAALESASGYVVEGDRLELRTAADQIAVQLTRN